MRITITVDDIMVELDDDNRNPTLDGIESVLKRMSETAFELYSKTYDATKVEQFSIDFHPAPDVEADDEDDEVDDA
jgi:methyl coenzyme M reductase subunit D